MRPQALKFSKDQDNEFITVLRKRVNSYFKDNHINKTGNFIMQSKAIFMFALFIVPYAFMVSGMVTNHLLFLMLWVIMGFGVSGIGLSIMHDANHGAFSKNKLINKILSYTLEIAGGSSRNWKIQHNKLHHTFTNVTDVDEDIKSQVVLRFSPHQKRIGLHRFQFIYAWLMYCIMTLYWVSVKDFLQINNYRKKELVSKKEFKSGLINIIVWKTLYYGYLLVLPIIIAPVPWYMVVFGFLILHAINGLALSAIFQTAHVMPTSDFPMPDDDGYFENNWAIHQLKTTTNYAPKSIFFSWFIGGLNFQVEHHLFPSICHVHYKKISKIVEQTAREYDLPYYYKKNFFTALIDHTKMLYRLGKGKGDFAYTH